MSDRIGSYRDYQQLRRSFRWQRPRHFNFGWDVLERQAERRPSSAALVWVAPDRRRVVTFAEMAQRSSQLAEALLQCGLQRGDRVLVVLPRVVEWWETMLGILKAGMVSLPGTTLLTSGDIAYRIRSAAAAGVITDEEGANKLEQIKEDLPSLKSSILVSDQRSAGWQVYEELLAAARPALPTSTTRADEPALIYFTSGTTGPPKMVLHSHASYGLGHQLTGFWLGLRPDDLHWNISDTGWAKAAWSSLFGPWTCGASLFVQYSRGKFRPGDVLEHLAQQPITTMCAAPTVYRMLVQQDLSNFRAARLHDCVAAGEPLNPEIIALWKKATGLTIRDGYGQTETVLLCGNYPGIPVRPGSMGLPAPGMDLAVIDAQGNRLSPGEEGDIALRVKPERPVGLFVEYLGNAQATARSFRDGWYVTGDRAKTDEDGFFWFVGRADDVITSSAYRIGPFEVESALLEHPAVAEAAVVGKPDALRGEIVKAFVVLAAGHTASESLKEELQQHVKRTTAPYKYPREVEFLDELPKTISGKIRRVELRRRDR